MDWWVYQSYVDITTGHPPLVLFHQSIDDSQWKMVWLTGMTGEQESTCRESSRVSEVVPRIIQLKEASHFSKVRSIPLIKAQRLSRWWCLAKSWSTGVEAPVAVVLHTLGLSEKGTKIGLFFKTWITFTLLRVIRTMTLFCHSFWHLIWKYIYIYMAYMFWHSIQFWHSFLPFYLAFLLAFFLACYCIWHEPHGDLDVPVGVRKCPLSSGCRTWGPAVTSRLGSGSAHWALDVAVGVHWALDVAVGVWQCPLSSGLPTWGPAMPIELWILRLGSGSAHWALDVAVGSGWALDLPLGVRQWPLSSGSCGWGPAVPIEVWMSRFGVHWALDVAVGVRQCPLSSGLPAWGPAMPIELWILRLGSGSAHWALDVAVGSGWALDFLLGVRKCHWALDVAVGVRQCLLSSGCRGWGPAMPSWALDLCGSGSAHWALDVAVGFRQCRHSSQQWWSLFVLGICGIQQCERNPEYPEVQWSHVFYYSTEKQMISNYTAGETFDSKIRAAQQYCFADVWLHPCSHLPISCVTVAWPKSHDVTLQSCDLQLLIAPPRTTFVDLLRKRWEHNHANREFMEKRSEFLATLWFEHESLGIPGV